MLHVEQQPLAGVVPVSSDEPQQHQHERTRFTHVSEFTLAYPALSFAIIDTQVLRAKRYNQLNDVTNANLATNNNNMLAVPGGGAGGNLNMSLSQSMSLATINQSNLAADTNELMMLIQQQQQQQQQQNVPVDIIPTSTSTHTSLVT